MQAQQDIYSTPRRTFDLEDYIDIARRHKGWIFGPLGAALVASVVGAFLWPDTYVSSATIKVTPQTVPEAYIQSNVNEAMSDRINAIAQTVLGRSTLTSVITTNELYPRERQRLPMEDVVELMRKDIKIGSVSNIAGVKDKSPAFQIQYSYTDRFKAKKVVEYLVNEFINTNLRERSSSSLATTELLKDQWKSSKQKLDELEDKLAAFRTAHQGQLPDEIGQNLQQISALQARMSGLNAALSRVSQEKLMMESELRIAKDRVAAINREMNKPVEAGGTAPKSERLTQAEREVRYLEDQVTGLRQHYKDTHPDLQRAQAFLAAAKKKRDQIVNDEETAQKQASPEARRVNPLAQREIAELDTAIRRMQSQIEAKDLEAAEYSKELTQADRVVKAGQAMLGGIPQNQKEYGEMVRDREMARVQFADIDQKMNRALLAKDMEDRKAGENLESLDTPSLPQTPTEPKRPIVVAMGTIVGLMVGILLAGAREVKDTSLKNMKDVRAYTKLPILGSVPLLENDLVVKRRRRFAWFAWSLACLTGLVVMSGSVIYYYATKV